MDTNELIKSLSADLRPVKRLRAPWLQTLLMGLAGAGLVAGGAFFFSHLRPDAAAQLKQPEFLIETGAMLAAGLLSAAAAAALSIPDAGKRNTALFSLLAATTLWLALGLHQLSTSSFQGDPVGIAAYQCAIDLGLLSLLPLAAAALLLRRSLWFQPGLAGYAIFLSMISLAAVGMRLLCSIEGEEHLLFWHVLPVMTLGASGILAGKIILRPL